VCSLVQTLQLRLALGARHAEQSMEELEVSLGALAAAVWCEVMLRTSKSEVIVLPAKVAASTHLRCIVVEISAPSDSPNASHVTLAAFCYGHRVYVVKTVIPVMAGIRAPLLLRDTYSCGLFISARQSPISSKV